MQVTIIDSKPPLSPADIQQAELALNVQLPASYRAFLLRFNGGRTEPSGLRIGWREDQVCGEDWRTSSLSWLYSIGSERTSNLVRSNTATFEGRLPAGTLTIGTDSGGNQILLGVAAPVQGQVLFWVKDHEVEDGETPGFENVGVIAASFEDFITQGLY